MIKEFIGEHGGSDKHRIARIFDINHQTARTYLQELHQGGSLYISGWTRTHANSKWHAIYSIRRNKDDTDEGVPPPISQSISMKRYRQSQRTKKEHYEYTSLPSEESSSDLS